jgi:putative transcriptional regulator
MKIEHHPDDSILAAFAAGTLDLGEHVAIATHLVGCAKCRRFVRRMEGVGGAVLTSLAPTPMAAGALEQLEMRLADTSEPEGAQPIPPMISDAGVPGLPGFVQKYRMGAWQWVAPRVHLRRIELPEPSRARIFLLRSGPGTRMLQHSHIGSEMTCVLSGAFEHEGGFFGPGDFDFGDETIDHRPIVNDLEDCICLVAMQGELRLKGLLGRAMQPFVRL